MFLGIGRQLLPADDRLHQLQADPRAVLRQKAGHHAAERRSRLQQVQQHVRTLLIIFTSNQINYF